MPCGGRKSNRRQKWRPRQAAGLDRHAPPARQVEGLKLPGNRIWPTSPVDLLNEVWPIEDTGEEDRSSYRSGRNSTPTSRGRQRPSSCCGLWARGAKLKAGWGWVGGAAATLAGTIAERFHRGPTRPRDRYHRPRPIRPGPVHRTASLTASIRRTLRAGPIDALCRAPLDVRLQGHVLNGSPPRPSTAVPPPAPAGGLATGLARRRVRGGRGDRFGGRDDADQVVSRSMATTKPDRHSRPQDLPRLRGRRPQR